MSFKVLSEKFKEEDVHKVVNSVYKFDKCYSYVGKNFIGLAYCLIIGDTEQWEFIPVGHKVGVIDGEIVSYSPEWAENKRLLVSLPTERVE